MIIANGLQAAYDHYHLLLTSLGEPPSWTDAGVMELLRSRDRLQQLIDQLPQQPNTQDLPPQLWLNLAKDDGQLGRWSEALGALDLVKAGRKSLNPPDHYWWWHSHHPEPKPWLSWLWGGLTLAAIPIILALAKDISARFLTNAPGFWGSIGLILPAGLGLFAVGGALTKVGSQIVESALAARLRSKRFWPLTQFVLAAFLLLGLLAFHIWGLPWAANRYFTLGERQYFEQGHLANAQGSWQRSLQLNPDFSAAQHHLGLTYEDQRNFDQAKAAYANAFSAGYLQSVNNLARLYLMVDNDPDSAAVLLLQALEDEARDLDNLDLAYTLHKNLGWAYLQQQRYLEAQNQLNAAILIEAQLDRPWPDAHCLLAQTLEAQGQQATAERENCRRRIELPEDDIWAKYLNQPPPEESENAETP